MFIVSGVVGMYKRRVVAILNIVLKSDISNYDEEIIYESIEFVDLIAMLEDEFKINVPIKDINERYFNSVNKINLYIERKVREKNGE